MNINQYSFYNLLCCMEFLKDDPFFSLSVDFDIHLFEHNIRVILSIIISILWFIFTISFNIKNIGIKPLDTIMFIAFILSLLIDIISNRYIKRRVNKYTIIIKSIPKNIKKTKS